MLAGWGFDGYRATDGGQISQAVSLHKFVPTLDQGTHGRHADGACGPQHHHPLRVWRARAWRVIENDSSAHSFGAANIKPANRSSF